ncbi:hypothetical protein K443DRAFT_674311 [Laccaria amethystina LaAM-08-1]|uniref:Uncharacterized protein n=1 Tax=Laccaria amethystina LaAM-08-1 TaxID=1095629 RepID=A0A0C9YDP7_9AGAR|nr:hypothetical protein K443DRAFT_674311 [Laccaria amethystina LaAM-08-1]
MMVEAKAIPDNETLSRAANIDVLNVKGDNAYVEQLAKVSQEALDAAVTSIVVIGCGEWNPIQSYAETTGFKGRIFADPTRTLYRELGMDIESLERTPAGQERRSYLVLGAFANATQSIWKALRHPSHIGKQGKFAQLGGEFIFGPGTVCSFASRMQHTEDRTFPSHCVINVDS